MSTKFKLLSREDFRNAVFERDNHKCIFCDLPAKDAHHIIERRLWPDGGYYIENGASVCADHHMACETTEISVEDVRIACGITKIIVPPHMYPDQPIDKWGNPVLQNGQRLKGELFFDESVQKVLRQGQVLELFTNQVKYPRTHHLPWSPGVHSDDRVIQDMSSFEGNRVIITEKMDGENTSLYSDYIHARSVDGRHHESRNWVKNFWSGISHDIPPGWRICGENMFAEHSIRYSQLPSYFMGFSVWNDNNICLSWDETCEWFDLLDITPVNVLFDDIYDQKRIVKIAEKLDLNSSEGYVLRVADAFSYGEFRHKAAKFVRENHVQTIKHWMHGQPVTPNSLRKT